MADRESPILITGGAGFLGSHVVEALLGRGQQVRVLDRAVPHLQHQNLDFRCGSFDDAALAAEALAGCQAVIHLAGTTLPKTSNDDIIFDLESNLLATIRLLELARAAHVNRVVFASSGGTVYGVPDRIPVSESNRTRPLCSYGIHKVAIENYLHLYHHLHGLEYRILRISNLYGERQRGSASQGAVAVFLQQAVIGGEFRIWGDGTVVRDYVYAPDAAEAFCLALEHTGQDTTFNIGSGQGVSVNELLDAIDSLMRTSIPRVYLPGRAFDVPVNVLDTTLAADDLRWRPHHSLAEGLTSTLAWLRSQSVSVHG